MNYICKMKKLLALGVSYIFHPLFLYFYLVLLLYVANPFAFNLPAKRELGVFVIMTFTILVAFPLISVLLMRNLSLIRSFKMDDKTERIGPLIATMIFYIWYYVNIRNNMSFPVILSSVALGSCIAIGLGFFINNFSKISLHTIGAGSFLAATILAVFHNSLDDMVITLPILGGFQVSVIFVLLLSVLIAGLIGTARLILRVHTINEIYGGYFIGIFAQVLSFRLMYLNL